MSEVGPNDLVPGNNYLIKHTIDQRIEYVATFLRKNYNVYIFESNKYQNLLRSNFSIEINEDDLNFYKFTEIGDPILKGGRRRKKSRRNKKSSRRRKCRNTKRRRC